jgi:hypothetical protein
MDEMVCLQCGKELEQDWAPCPHCGWKAPESWEEAEEESPATPKALLAKPRKWISLTAWVLLAAALAGFLIFKF